MLILGIDTSLDSLGVALSAGDHVICELATPAGNTLPRLLPTIDYLLAIAKVSIRDIELIAVVVGPGLWTSLRIGVTTAKTLAHALDCPVVRVSTFEALACNVRWADRRVYTLVDAKRGNVHIAEYSCSGDSPRMVSPPTLVSLAELNSSIDTSGIILGALTQFDISSHEATRALLAPSSMSRIRPASVVEAGWRAYIQWGPTDRLSLAPEYMQETGLRPPVPSLRD
jgi:tRNA threonylcarbamoyladenosine biosynthesis protein TsaB